MIEERKRELIELVEKANDESSLDYAVYAENFRGLFVFVSEQSKIFNWHFKANTAVDEQLKCIEQAISKIKELQECCFTVAAEISVPPRWVCLLMKKIYENTDDSTFNVDFLQAIPAGITDKQLKAVYHRISSERMTRLLELELSEDVASAIKTVKELHDAESDDEAKWARARDDARNASFNASFNALNSAAAAYAASAAAAAAAAYATDVFATISAYAAAEAAANAATSDAAAARKKEWQSEKKSLLNALSGVSA